MDDKVLLQGDKSLLEGLVESPFSKSHQKKKEKTAKKLYGVHGAGRGINAKRERKLTAIDQMFSLWCYDPNAEKYLTLPITTSYRVAV